MTLTEREKDVIALARHRLAECKDGVAPGYFVLADPENAVLWLKTIVRLAEMLEDREHSGR
jgi:hypothetical protein